MRLRLYHSIDYSLMLHLLQSAQIPAQIYGPHSFRSVLAVYNGLLCAKQLHQSRSFFAKEIRKNAVESTQYPFQLDRAYDGQRNYTVSILFEFEPC